MSVGLKPHHERQQCLVGTATDSDVGWREVKPHHERQQCLVGTATDSDVGWREAPPRKAAMPGGHCHQQQCRVAQSPTMTGKSPGGHYHRLRYRVAVSSPTIQGSDAWWASQSTATSGCDRSPTSGSNVMQAPPISAMSGGYKLSPTTESSNAWWAKLATLCWTYC